MFDSEGHALTVSFGDKDAATADSILNGDGIKNTTIDTGFLKYELNPDYSDGHFANFQFLEQMVNHFSNVGSTQPLSPQFSTLTYKNESVVHVAKEVTFTQEERDMVSVNGVWSITETGAKNGYSLVNGVPVQTEAKAKASATPLDGIKPPQSLMTMLLSLPQNSSAKKHV